MLVKNYLFAVFFCLSFIIRVDASENDKLEKILTINNENAREQQLCVYLDTLFNTLPLSNFNKVKTETDALFTKYHVKQATAIDYFIENVYQNRAGHYHESETALLEAIESAKKMQDHYLVYFFFSHLGFLQHFLGNTTTAVSSFRMAKKEAILLNDAKQQVIIDINISDLYYHINFYDQSLFYLDQADSILANTNLREQRLYNAVNSNKAENYFRMGDLPSLKDIDRKMYAVPGYNHNLYSFKKRTDYYILLLQQDYKTTIDELKILKADTAYAYDSTDDQNLADAYYSVGKLDSAKAIVNRLFNTQQQKNHPEINFHLYALLGDIAQKQTDFKTAADKFKLALQESERNQKRLTRIGDISSDIKADELEGFYVKKESNYRNELTWLTISIILAMITLIIGAMLYRNIRQKQYYEKLLFAAKKEELAFINSHEVRRHLSNILGIIDTINHSEDKDEGYLQAEQHLLSAAKSLDDAIKNISDKLNN